MVTYSQPQTDIFTWIDTASGDAVVQARAGSGKTFTLKEAAKRIGTARAIFFAFNRHIKDELNESLTGTRMRAMTIHGFGLGVLTRAFGKIEVDKEGKKYRQIAETYCKMTASRELSALLVNPLTRKDAEAVIKVRTRALVKLVNMARMTRTLSDDLDALAAMMTRYGIETDGPEGDAVVLNGVRPCIGQGLDILEKGKVADYTDMLFAPLVLRLPVPLYDWIFVDEAQDLNACQRELVLRARGRGGRILFVGDDKQAIMGFAGADTASFAAIQTATNAVVLPLPICYRCPATHLALARCFVPDIEDGPNAIQGTISVVKEAQAVKLINEGSLTMCRTTAPLISLCLRLIAAGKPARVRGRDIAAGLVELAERIAELGAQNGTSFLETLDAWENAQIVKLSESEDNEAAITAVLDKCDCLRLIYQEWNTPTVSVLCREITALFSDDQASIVLATVHRCKGLEADHTFVLYPRMLPFAHPRMTDEDRVQEDNLTYVALTRAKVSMTMIDADEETDEFDPIEHFAYAGAA